MLLSFYKPRVYMTLFLSCLLLSLIACTKDEDNGSYSDSPAPAPEIEADTIKSEAAESPQRSVKFTINDSPSSIQLVAHAPGVEVRLLKLTDPRGNVLFDSNKLQDRNLTTVSEFQASPLTFNYPLLSNQTRLSSGEYTAEYETRDPNDFEFKGAEITLDVISKNDPDLENGTLNLNVVLGGVASNTKDIKDGVESAMDLVSTMLARYGISIFSNIIELPESPEVLPNPFKGNAVYEEASKQIENGINIFVVNNIDSFNGPRYNSAISGSSPGPVIPSPRSAIAVSLTIATGQDGLFDANDTDSGNSDNVDDSEIRLLAESITHEILRYLGLQDSVTFGSYQVTSTDGLDSEKCTNIDSCEDSKGANGNLMFPFALPDDDSGTSGEKFYPRDRLSPQQVEIAQRYVGLD